MTIAERHKYILDKLHAEGYVGVADLSRELDVTMVTVRKDLKLLEDKQLLYRTHGSATAADPYIKDRSVQEKRLVQADEKQRIAQKAVSLLADEDAIILGSGTTVLAFAQAIPRTARLTVLTGAMNVSLALLNAPDVELVQLGGVVRKSSASVVGSYADEMITTFACSKLFLSVDGISLDQGLTTSNMMEAHLNTRMIAAAQKTIVLADSSKFGRKGFGKICPLEEVEDRKSVV